MGFHTFARTLFNSGLGGLMGLIGLARWPMATNSGTKSVLIHINPGPNLHRLINPLLILLMLLIPLILLICQALLIKYTLIKFQRYNNLGRSCPYIWDLCVKDCIEMKFKCSNCKGLGWNQGKRANNFNEGLLWQL